jgi:ribokinase
LKGIYYLLRPGLILVRIVIVGSANADIYVEVDRLPLEGETISARSGRTLPGGKGANQAFCSARLSRSGHCTFFIDRLSNDAHGRLLEDSLGESLLVRNMCLQVMICCSLLFLL